MQYVSVPGYPYPVAVSPPGVSWRFDPTKIDTSSGEPIVRTVDGYWVWGRGCTQPGGGLVPAWGFVRTSSVPAGTGATPAGLPAGLGASSSSSAVPVVLLGGLAVAVVGVLLYAAKERTRTVEDEAHDYFPEPFGHAPASRILAYKAAAARCFYTELREEHSPSQAAGIVQRALKASRGWLTGLARRGATIDAGCSLLRSYAPARYSLPA